MTDRPPEWALQRAGEELYDVEDVDRVTRRAWEIARQERQIERERHDEYDDPDEGGEG
ncbi:hypothetical protein [Nocardioides marmoribigeumensis]|uniref:Uncharacterized protein n=1 Tax=Nocardioides marmoribigeumensis TaxID=433649 RepID=A0ABU2BWP0_9ACTN|nr:hypothetical protein [Nocardioides marmoribigeumensis]MDR7362639.1 hypothetical protein [Nocardioides marmoribigeumensis]